MNNKEGKLPGKVKIIFVIILLLLLFAICMTRFLAKSVETDAHGYPESTLLRESDGTHVYRENKELNHTFGCPSIPYDISVPGEVSSYTGKRMSLIYDDMGITLLETENEALDELENRLCTYTMEAVDVPASEWTDIISDQGYVNGYLAEYHTGKVKISGKIENATCYAVMYCVETEAAENLMICITCSKKDDLYRAKVLLDDIMYSLKPQNESVAGTEEVREENANDMVDYTEKTEQDEMLDMMETTEAVSESGGIEVAEKDFAIQVDKEYDTGLYIVFRWINDMSQPITLYVTDPDGKRYEKDDELSREGEWVFVIPDNKKGEYVIHGEATSSIYVNYYEAMGKAQYYEAYQNIDIETGEPVRGIGE